MHIRPFSVQHRPSEQPKDGKQDQRKTADDSKSRKKSDRKGFPTPLFFIALVFHTHLRGAIMDAALLLYSNSERLFSPRETEICETRIPTKITPQPR